MRFFTNKSIWHKIIIIFLIIFAFQFLSTNYVQAADDAVEFGGKLMSPVLSLMVSLGDGVMDLIGRAIMGATASLYEVDREDNIVDLFLTALVAIAAAAVVIALSVLTMGLAAAALTAVGITATATVGIGTVIAGVGAGLAAGVWFNDEVLPNELYLPMYTYSVEEIFKGNILLFNVDFFNGAPEIQEKYNDNGELQYYYYMKDENGDGVEEEIKTSKQDSAEMLQKTVSSWYNAIRSICMVAMLSVLVYIGIRMLLSSVASDKAKYKTMLKDWFVGLCLLFIMHYIMAFSVTLVGKLTDVVKTSMDENSYFVVLQDENGKLKKAVDENHLNQPDLIQNEGGNDYLYWPTNLMGKLRLELQMEQYGAQYVGLAICFIILSVFTLLFTFTYLKRLLYMAFLTLIAPMVALTYCIDKVNDGQAQGFNKWFKEYIFNLLIQPMHLLLYFILVTSAFELAGENVIYSIVAIGFMLPAERLLRSLFNFEKAQTPGILGPAGTMLMMNGINKLSHMVGGRGQGGNNSGPKEVNPNDKKKGISTDDTNPLDRLYEANISDANNNIRTDPNENVSPELESRLVSNMGGSVQQTESGLYVPGSYASDTNNNGTNTLNNGDNIRMANQSQLEGEGSADSDGTTQSLTSNNDNTNKKQPGKFGTAFKRSVRGNTAALQTMAKNAAKKVPSTARKIAIAGAIGAPAAAAIGSLGLAVGAASGDPSKVATGLAAGATAGGLATRAVTGYQLSSDVQEAYQTAHDLDVTDEERMQDEIEKARKEWQKRENKEKAIGKLGGENAAMEFINGDNLARMKSAGIHDMKHQLTIEKGVQDGEFTIDEGIGNYQMLENFGFKNPEKDAKLHDRINKTLSNGFVARGASEAAAKRGTEKAMRGMVYIAERLN